VRSKPQSCTGCALHAHGTDFSAVEGTGANGVLLVGEASGSMEARDQLPFRPYAPAGSVLERCLRRMGLDRKQFSVTNVIRCHPRHDWLEGAPWEYSALRSCRPNLDRVIEERKPRVIVALGGVALRELTGEAGEARGVTHLAGYVLPLASGATKEYICGMCEGKDSQCDHCMGTGKITRPATTGAIPVLADFHPSYLRRGKASHQGVFSRIIQRALQIAKGADREWAWGIDPSDCSTWNTPSGKLSYWTHPTLDQANSALYYLRDNPRLPFAQDIETYESASLDEDARDGFSDTQIRLAQFSFQPGTGMALPWEGGFKEVARELWHLKNQKFGHNWDNFDHKVLRACAAREGWHYAPTERVFDTLDMFHHWQPDLPAHLQFCSSFIKFPFPWKHLAGTDIEFYGICDVDADLRLGTFLESVLKKDGLWGQGDEYSLTYGYTGQEREVRPVLAAMEDRGVPVDDQRRMELGAEFDKAQSALGALLLPRFPESAKKLDPYKTFPPELKKLPEERWGELFREPDKWRCRCDRENKMDASSCGKCGGDQEQGRVKAGKWYRYGQREVEEAGLDAGGSPQLVKAVRWCYIPEFNPNSGKMLIEYMRAKGHSVPKSKEEDDQGNQKDTTAAKELQRLAVRTSDDFYLKVIEYRGLSKLRGTYVEGFRPGSDGRVHPTFTFDTGTAQMSARNPNTTNFPKLKPTPELAKAMRGMIAAPKGYVIAEWDYKSCHALTLGYLAESPNYMRMSRLDIHSFVAGHFLNLWNAHEIIGETDQELKARFKWLKSDPERKRIRDDQAKHAILGIGNGLKAKGLFERYMEQFPPRSCPQCVATGKVAGLRGLKKCPLCDGTGRQSGQSIATELLRILEELFPEVFAWQKRMQDRAHREQFLKTEFGHVRRFYEVFRWDGKKSAWGHGDQAEEAVAFWLANIAFGHIRESLKALGRSGLDAKWQLFNHIHDSFMLLVPEDRIEEHAREIAPVLLAPSKVLTNPKVAPGGLVIDVEASVGRDWASMEEIVVPREKAVEMAHMMAPVEARVTV
jgi:uracil-DNA glycosylase family 4